MRAGAIADLKPATMIEDDATANMATIILRHNGSIFAIVSAFGSGSEHKKISNSLTDSLKVELCLHSTLQLNRLQR